MHIFVGDGAKGLLAILSANRYAVCWPTGPESNIIHESPVIHNYPSLRVILSQLAKGKQLKLALSAERLHLLRKIGKFGRGRTSRNAQFVARFLKFDYANTQEVLEICLQIGGVQPPQNLQLLAKGEFIH